MSLIIFFGFSFFIIVVSLVIISVTLFQWRKEAQLKKQLLEKS